MPIETLLNRLAAPTLGQTIALQLQEKGLMGKDHMGGRYPLPSHLHPLDRNTSLSESLQAGLLTSQELESGIQIASPQLLAVLDRLVQEKSIDSQKKEEILQELPPEYVLGIDVSHWQDNLSQEWWDKLAESGIKFVFVKLTGGSVDPFYKDPMAIQNIERALKAGIAVGGYIFVNPAHEVKDQVDSALDYAGSLQADMKLGLAFDLEISNGQSGYLINERMERAITYANQQQGIYATWLYTSAGFANGLTGLTLDGVKKQYLTWPASWTTADKPTMAHFWADLTWDAWQNTNRFLFERLYLDGNKMQFVVFNHLINNGGENGETITITLPREQAAEFASQINDLQALSDKIKQAL